MLHAVILAGGSGTRFWPLSRRARPKQLLPLAGTESLLRQSFARLEGLIDPDQVHVITSELLAAAVRAELPELPRANLLAEPQGRDTALAAAVGAAVIAARDPDAVLAVLPADHVIGPRDRFQAALREAAELAAGGDWIVTFGIPASSPHTGYGYVRRGEPLTHQGALGAFVVEAFEEKPDQAAAEAYVAGGQHYWNSGIFVWKAQTLLDGLRLHQPQVAAAAERIAAADGPDRAQVLREEYERAEKISIDYALLERAERVVVLAADFEWSDVGSWSALPALSGVDGSGNTVQGAACVAVDAAGCIVQGDGRLVALLGVEDLIVVQTTDATLIARKDRAQDLKAIVERLEAEGLDEVL